MTRAIILAAGEGTRLRPHTADRPKCLVPFAGRPLLEWQLDALRAAGVDAISLVTGYRADALAPYGLASFHNERFATTNMVTSLVCAGELFDGADDVLIAYGDLLYEPRIVRALLGTDAARAITVDRQWRALWELRMDDPLTDAETLRLSPEGDVVELGRRATGYDQIEGQYMGLVRVAAHAAPDFLTSAQSIPPDARFDGRSPDRMYLTDLLQHLVDSGRPVRAVLVDGGWIEIDTVDDLLRYEALEASGRLDTFFDALGG